MDREEWIDQCILNPSNNRPYKDNDRDKDKYSLEINSIISDFTFIHCCYQIQENIIELNMNPITKHNVL